MATKENPLQAGLSDDVHCPVCLEIFTDPQTLNCLHTFCQRCTQQLTRHGKVVCPTCRKETQQDQIKHDFKTAKLVDVYNQQSAAARPLQPAAGSELPCNLCDDKPAHVYCSNCQTCLCYQCQKIHVKTKTSTCEAKHSEKLDGLLDKYRKNLNSTKIKLLTQKTRFLATKKEILDTNDETAEECLRELKKSEEDTVNQVRSHYREQREKVVQIKTERNQEVAQRCDQLVKVTEEMIERTDQVKSSVEVLIAEYDSFQKQITQQVEILCSQMIQPLRWRLTNRESLAFDWRKALAVEEKCTSLTQKQKISQGGMFKKMQSQALYVTKLAETKGRIYQLQVVGGQLWGLMDDQIVTLTEDGSIGQTFMPGFRNARDMCLSRSRRVIVASDSGLIQLNAAGQQIGCIDEGKYWSVTKNDHWSVWAVKEEKWHKLWIIKFRVTDETCEQLVKLQTEIRSNDYSEVYCSVLQESLYLCSWSNHCIYKVNTSTGQTLAQYGQWGRQAAGELCGPTNIYSDAVSQSLLICDQLNDRLQVLKPAENRWSVVKTQGQKLERPHAVTVDGEERIWVISSLIRSNQLYSAFSQLL